MADIGAVMKDIFGSGLTPEEIYYQITNGPGNESLERAKDSAADQSKFQTSISARVQKLQGLIAGGWTGAAADQATNAATPVVKVAQMAEDQLRMSQELHAAQSNVYDYSKNNVVPVPENPGEPDFIDNIFPMLTDHAEKKAAYSEAAQQNKNVYDTYDGMSTTVGEKQPTDFGSLLADTSGMDISLQSSSGNIEHVGGTPSQPHVPSGGVTSPPPGGGTPTPAPGTNSGGVPIPSPGQGTPNPGQTGGQTYIPAANNQQTTTSGYVPPSTSGYPPNVGSYQYPGGTSFGPGSGSSSNYGGTSFGPIGGLSSGGSGSGYGGGSSGRGASGIGGVNEPGAKSLGGGRAVGAGLHGEGAAGSSARGGAAGGRSGLGGSPMGAAGQRGEGAEDTEHKTAAYLQEYDPEDVFVGDLPRTTPPVIGA